jgi:hypothetical protein
LAASFGKLNQLRNVLYSVMRICDNVMTLHQLSHRQQTPLYPLFTNINQCGPKDAAIPWNYGRSPRVPLYIVLLSYIDSKIVRKVRDRIIVDVSECHISDSSDMLIQVCDFFRSHFFAPSQGSLRSSKRVIVVAFITVLEIIQNIWRWGLKDASIIVDEKKWCLAIDSAPDLACCAWKVHDCVITDRAESFSHVLSFVALLQKAPYKLCLS